MKRSFVLLVSILLIAPTTFAHIRIYPTESTAGIREKYVMRVPNEKQVNCVRVEGEFPAGLDVYGFEHKPGWTLTVKKNDAGKVVGATWTGTMVPLEFVEFGMLAINPAKGASLEWRFVQHYADGMKEEFIGPVGSPLPAPVVTLKAPAAQ